MRLLVFMSFVSILFGCTKNPGPVPNANLMPAPFDFTLIDTENNSAVVFRENQSIKLWYLTNGQPSYIEDLKIKPIINSNQFELYATTVIAPLKSSEKIAKTFYLQIDNGKTDTIFLDVKRLPYPVEREYNVYVQVKFNGKEVTFDLNHKPALWIFKR